MTDEEEKTVAALEQRIRDCHATIREQSRINTELSRFMNAIQQILREFETRK